MADRVPVLLDVLVGGVVGLADPLGHQAVEAEQHLRLAGQLRDGAAVTPHEGVDLPARAGRQLGVEPAERDELHLPLGIPSLAPGEHQRRAPGVRPDDGDADRLPLEVAQLTDARGHVEREVIPLDLGGDVSDRRPRPPEDRHVGGPRGADVHLLGQPGLQEGGTALERLEFRRDAGGLEEPPIERDEDRYRQGVATEDGGPDPDGRTLSPGWTEAGRQCTGDDQPLGRDLEELSPGCHHGEAPLWVGGTGPVRRNGRPRGGGSPSRAGC